MIHRALAAAAFAVLPLAAYLAGKASAPQARAAASEVVVLQTASPRSAATAEFRVEEAPRMAFVDLYQSLESCAGDCRRDAVRQLREISARGKRRAATASMFKCLAMLDLDSAIALLPQIEGDEDRMTAVVALLAGAPTMLTPKLVKVLMELPGEFGERARTQTLPGQLSFWSALDPSAVAQFLDANPSLLGNDSAQRLIANWAARDPDAAQAWLSQHVELSADAELAEAMVHGLYQNDPDTARRYVLSNVADERFVPLIATLATITLMSSRDDAAAFVHALPDAETRRGALAAAAKRISVLLPAPEFKGLHDHKELAEWLLTFSAAERTGIIEKALQTWQTVEPRGPSKWVRELPLEKQQEVFRGFSGDVNEVVLRAALAVHDTTLREQVLKRFSNQFEHDAAPALFALAAGFTPEEVNVLRHWVQKAEPQQPVPSRTTR